MGDNLPLIPEKDTAICADVRPVLREVFRELDCLPPLAVKHWQKARNAGDGDSTLPRVEPWIDRYETDSREIWQREGDLKQEHARRISNEPLPNIYKLHPKQKPAKAPAWKTKKGILQRKDLMPLITQNAGRDDSLWVKNILHMSSGNLASVEVKGSRMRLPVQLSSARKSSFQSLSIGEVVSQPPSLAVPPSPPPPQPEYILCVPPTLNFVNFTVGQMQCRTVRLVNISKFECRLSLRPPARRELELHLCGARGLTVTSGAATELKVFFRPRDVRVLRDTLQVRVSTGKTIIVPICCYMEPPLLDILVPATPSSMLSWGAETGVVAAPGGSDVLELGARLLGAVHVVPVLLHCQAEHAAFFLLTEDAWLSFSLDALSSHGSLVEDPFVVQPAWWSGGGVVRARVWCRARAAGLHAAALRVLSCTAAVRQLHLLADSLLFRIQHVTVEAQPKDYDICSDDDPACEYYVHLGTAFPGRALAATVQLVNHSPVVYSYYWSVRPWGACSCWEEEKAQGFTSQDSSERLCVGAREARDRELAGSEYGDKSASVSNVRVEPGHGSLAPRSSCSVYVCAPDVGSRLGVQRAVLMLILKDIPKESFPSDYDPMIVKTEIVDSDPIPGVERWSREVCEVVCGQMEVWWEVAPVRFVLDPPVMPLFHSRRVSAVEVCVRGTQLAGCEPVAGEWRVPRAVPQPAPLRLLPSQSSPATIRWPLPVLPNEYPETDVITLCAAGGEWEAACAVRRQCESRHPALSPARCWLDVVPPETHMQATLKILNDTHQHICWWATPYRWFGENVPSGACASPGRAPCPACQERACSCALLRPSRGALSHGVSTTMYYDVNAPQVDGCVATVVQARRTCADVGRVLPAAGVHGRAALLAYRVLAPRLTLRVLPARCAAPDAAPCEGCELDEGGRCAGGGGGGGTATLRPRAALTLSRTCSFRLRVSNLTPISTAVTWEPPLEDDVLSVTFIPNQLEVGSYGEVEFEVDLGARRVCPRRVFPLRARVRHAQRPLYLLIDTAIAGLEVEFEVPIGGHETTDSTLIMRRTQQEERPRPAASPPPRTPPEIFAAEDMKRAIVAENICRCRFELQYIPPEKRPRPPPQGPDDYPPVEIVWEPPAMTRVCPCFECSKPCLPDHAETLCLQFMNLPLNTVRSRRLRLRNLSALPARWSTTVRRWPRTRTRTLDKDEWAHDIREPGVAVQCAPPGGELPPRATRDLHVLVYADCWGLYRDQLLIQVTVRIESQIEELEPLVVDLWVQAVGAPLQFALDLTDTRRAPIVLWMSASAPERTVRLRNRSRAELAVHASLLTEHEHPQDALPFRLYFRLVDALPRTCPCLARDSESAVGEGSTPSAASSYEEEMDTLVELFLGPDLGRQDRALYQVSPECRSVPPGAWADWQVTLAAPPNCEVAPPTAVMLRALPLLNQGEGWYRPDPLPQVVRLRQAAREGRLKASCSELSVQLCALDLPSEDVLRVRKSFRIQNVGSGPMEISARTRAPWSLVLDAGCGCGLPSSRRECCVPLHLLPRSSLQMCVEVRVSTAEAWLLPNAPAAAEGAPPPAGGPAAPECSPTCTPAPSPSPAPRVTLYDKCRRTTTKLRFYDTDNVLLTVPLRLELEYPVISIEPATIDFGFVTDGDTRKSYFSVSHSSSSVSVDVVSEWEGSGGFRLWPRHFTLRPRVAERLYLQYTARWCGAPQEGYAVVRAACGAGREWCVGRARARAAAARDSLQRMHGHDHTDDTHLL